MLGDNNANQDTQGRDMVSSREILEKTGIKSAKTLTRWHQRGLIPPPEIRTHPSGRGKMAYWPAWVLRRIDEVRALLNDGMSLEDIADKLGADWQAEEKRLTRNRRDLRCAVENERRRDARDRFVEAIAEKIYDSLRRMGVERPGIFGKLAKSLSSRALVKRALELMQQEFTPVLVIVGDRINVTADFRIGDICGGTETSGQPLLVVPIREEILAAYSQVNIKLPLEPTFVSAKRVLDQLGGKEHSYHADSVWKLALDEEQTVEGQV